jgi:hypothetical protein
MISMMGQGIIATSYHESVLPVATLFQQRGTGVAERSAAARS